LLARFAKAAGAGEMLNIQGAAYEKAIGHATSNSTVYNVLARHGWRKLMPRPFHPKRDIAAQTDYMLTWPISLFMTRTGSRALLFDHLVGNREQ